MLVCELGTTIPFLAISHSCAEDQIKDCIKEF